MKRFLIVDCHKAFCGFMTAYVRSKGHACSQLHDPSDIRLWLAQNNCDGILLDLATLQIDVLGCITQLRASFPAVRIIVLTGPDHGSSLIELLYKAGIVGCVSKGYEAREIFFQALPYMESAIPAVAAA